MTRPPREVADLVRAAGRAFIDSHCIIRPIRHEGYFPVGQVLDRETTLRTGVNFGLPNVTEMILGSGLCANPSELAGWPPSSPETYSKTGPPQLSLRASAAHADRLRVAGMKIRGFARNGRACRNFSATSSNLSLAPWGTRNCFIVATIRRLV